MATVITQTANPAGVSASANVATYTAASIGTAAPNRIVVVLVGSELASTPIASCTIGGNAMTAGTQGNRGAVYARAFYLLYPTGTTADIAVTFTTNSPTSTQNHIAVYTVVGGTYSSTGADQSTDMDSTDPLTTGSISIASGGGFIAVAASATDTNAKSWANATEDIDADGGALRFTTATRTTSLTTTAVTCTGTTNGEDGALSYFIFGANTSPTVALNSPADSATGVSTTPVLDFTGTDAESNDVRYEVQVHTSSSFPADMTASNLTTGTSTTDGTVYTTASISPSAYDLVLCHITLQRADSAAPSTPTVTGNGITYDLIDRVDYDIATTSRNTTFLFRGMSASPSSGAITITCGETTDQAIWAIDKVTGADTSGTNGSGAIVQSATNVETTGSGNSLTVTLGAFSSTDNATYGAFADDGADNYTEGSGFTKLGYAQITSDLVSQTEWKSTNDTSVDISFNVNDLVGGIAIEIKKATTLIDAVSGTDAGFANPDVGGDTDPFTSGDNIQYTVQSALSNSTVYYWRVRGIDPAGSNSYGAWATTRSFTTTAAGGTVVKDMMGMGMIPFPR